jgi:hypothetical protein
VVGLSDGAATAACAGRAGCEFDAALQSGTTGFFIPPGDYAISLVPLGADGAPLGGSGCSLTAGTGCWATPAPVRRTIATGEVVSLGTLLVAIPDCPLAPGCRNPIPDCPALQ